MKNINYVEIVAPFSGFYGTVHGGLIDSIVESYIEGDEDTPKSVEDDFNHQAMRISYCKNWVINLSSLIINNKYIKDINIKFKELESPKFYNFENDRLIMEIDTVSIQKIQDIVTKECSKELEEHLKNKFTSYSGFTSFYPNNTKEFLLYKEDINTRSVYFELFLEHVLGIEPEELMNLIRYEEIRVIYNEE